MGPACFHCTTLLSNIHLKKKSSKNLCSFHSQLSSFCCCLFGQTFGMWKLPGQGSNPGHSHDLSHSDNAGSLTARPPGNSSTYSLKSIKILSAVSGRYKSPASFNKLTCENSILDSNLNLRSFTKQHNLLISNEKTRQGSEIA